jgi:hypothetical protein
MIKNGLQSAVLVAVMMTAPLPGQRPVEWPVHSLQRPHPAIIHPGGPALIAPPADAVILFDGTSLDAWRADADSGVARWRVVAGALEVAPGTGGIHTAEMFGDVQLHVEWQAPAPAEGTGQNRSNSGIFLMGRYEVQVLDSWENVTYADGQAAAIYGQFPPLVNVSLPPGSWQSYDIIFRRPRFDAAGNLTVPARITALHNGVLVHEDVVLQGQTAHQTRAKYLAHADRLPIALQDHGTKVRFRNIWVRPLTDQP